MRIPTVPGFIPYRLASREKVTASFRMVIASANEHIAVIVKILHVCVDWKYEKQGEVDWEISVTPEPR